MKFSELSEKKKTERCTTPILVSCTKDPDQETDEQIIENHDRFRKLPFEIKYKLGFQHTPDIVKSIGKRFQLDLSGMAGIARAIRSFYFRDISRVHIPDFLVEHSNVAKDQAQKITEVIFREIIDVEVFEEQTILLPILDALAKYQRLSEQTITEDRIVVKNEVQPVRGSLRNWVRHYRDSLGIRKHSPMERGQFLFQGKNTRYISAEERERLSLIFRSIDDGVPVSIDTDRQEVIFPVFEEKKAFRPDGSSTKASEEMGTSFRPNESFPESASPFRKSLEWKTSATGKLAATDQGRAQTASSEFSDKRLGQDTAIDSDAVAALGKLSFSSKHVLPSEKGWRGSEQG